jgi:NAD(P)-dependent dehydrogenase (short-subunit alcohol dehydrogenase family)
MSCVPTQNSENSKVRVYSQVMKVILSINSDIGTALALNWLAKGDKVSGTYRIWNSNCKALEEAGAILHQLDLLHFSRNDIFNGQIKRFQNWDTLICASGMLEPIDLFESIEPNDWVNSFWINFTSQVFVISNLLKFRSKNSESSIIMFAGGGTNSANERYSAYTVAKIATIKFCELLNHEQTDCRVWALGPGWVDTRIHDATIKAGQKAGKNYDQTILRRSSGDMVSIDSVIECINWGLSCDKATIGGRNISLVGDNWGNSDFVSILKKSPDALKLRRKGLD